MAETKKCFYVQFGNFWIFIILWLPSIHCTTRHLTIFIRAGNLSSCPSSLTASTPYFASFAFALPACCSNYCFDCGCRHVRSVSSIAHYIFNCGSSDRGYFTSLLKYTCSLRTRLVWRKNCPRLLADSVSLFKRDSICNTQIRRWAQRVFSYCPCRHCCSI